MQFSFPPQRQTPPIAVKVYSCLLFENHLFFRRPAAQLAQPYQKIPQGGPQKIQNGVVHIGGPGGGDPLEPLHPHRSQTHRGRQAQKCRMVRNRTGSSIPRGTMMTTLPSRFMMLTGLPVLW